MNIEQTKRMNHMIKQLTQKGIVTEFDQAVQVASDLYANAMPDEPQAAVLEQEEPLSEADAGAPSGGGMSHSIIMEDVEKKIQARISAAIEHNNQLINEQFKRLWSEVQKQFKEMEQQVQRKPSKETQKKIAASSEQASSTAAPSPRNGDFTPDNVELEKYFYYGK